MRTISRYVTGSFVTALVAAWVVITFVMLIAVVFKTTDLLARGVPAAVILTVVAYGLPATLIFSLPLSALTSSLLVFGRLSADGEIAAMRTCGISLWRVLAGPLAASVCVAAVCVFVNNELVPRSHYARRVLSRSAGMVSPVDLLEPGYFVRDIPGMVVYVGRKRGNKVWDERIYDLKSPVRREIRAASGVIGSGTNDTGIVVDLFKVRIDPMFDDRPGPGYAEQLPVNIPYARKSGLPRKRAPSMTFAELYEGIRNAGTHFPQLSGEDIMRQRMSLAVELNKRMALSVACLSFVILGIPLGIKTHRRESSIGVAISLFLVLGFYLFIIIADTLSKYPAARPDLITWLPVVISVVLGTWLIERAQ